MSRGFIDVELSIPNRDSDKIGERLESFCAAWPNMFQGLRQRMPGVKFSRVVRATYFHTAEKSSSSVVNRKIWRPLDREFIEVVKEEKSGCNRRFSVTFSNDFQ